MASGDTFNFVGAVASVCALLIVVAQLLWRLAASTKRKRQAAESALEELVSSLCASGQSLPARTDLGFLVTIELGSLRESAARWRFLATISVVAVVFVGVVLSASSDRLMMLAASVGSVVLLGILLYAMLSLHRDENYADSYERRVKEIWEQPVAKRSPSQTETA